MNTQDEIEILERKRDLLEDRRKAEVNKELFEDEARRMRETGKKTRFFIRDMKIMIGDFLPDFVEIESIQYSNYPPEFFDMLASFCQQTIDRCNKDIKKLEQLK